MARITHPSYIKFSGGRMGDLVFYNFNQKQYARLYTKPINPDTALQRIVRRTFADAVRSWQALSPEEQYKYNKKARRLPMTGYNLYISTYMKNTLHSGNKKESSLFTSSESLSVYGMSPLEPRYATVGAYIPVQYGTFPPGL